MLARAFGLWDSTVTNPVLCLLNKGSESSVDSSFQIPHELFDVGGIIDYV